MTASLDKRLTERADFEATSIATVLNDLRRNIEAELRGTRGRIGPAASLQFTNDDERVQLDRDLEALRQRLEEIPGEIAREQRGHPQPLLEPAVPVVPCRGHVPRAGCGGRAS